MESLIVWIINIVLLLILVRLWIWRRDVIAIRKISQTKEFRDGYDRASIDYKSDGHHQALETIAIYKQRNEFDALIYGYACGIADARGEPWPHPWGEIPSSAGKQGGFTFIELLIVVAIVVIIAAVAVGAMHTVEQKKVFMDECAEYKPKFECEVMWSETQPKQMIIWAPLNR